MVIRPAKVKLIMSFGNQGYFKKVKRDPFKKLVSPCIGNSKMKKSTIKL